MKILFLPRYGQLGSSSRMRFYQFLPWFESAGIECVVSPFFDDQMLSRKYKSGGYQLVEILSVYWKRIHALLGRGEFDLVWIEKEALPWFPVWMERLLLSGKPYILDFDDAVFHRYGMHSLALVRLLYGRRIEELMKGARFIVAGNGYLAKWATAAGARAVQIFPTVVDRERYVPKQEYSLGMKPRIVWIGSPPTVKYLLELSESLALLALRQPFILRVIGGGNVSMPGVELEVMNWSADSEAEAIAECDVGIMPLHETPWELGKCAYKLIQYMAAGLPTVSSPVGANVDVVVDGETGFFAASASQWSETLEQLLCDAELRQRLGKAGRMRVEEHYSLQSIAPGLVKLFSDAVVQ